MMRDLKLAELARRISRNVVWHDCFGKAAELAFYFQLALFPLLIFVLTLISFMSGAREIIISWLGTLMPSDSTNMIDKWVHNVLGGRSGGLLSFSLIFSLWSSSQGVRALLVALTTEPTMSRKGGRSGNPSFWRLELPWLFAFSS